MKVGIATEIITPRRGLNLAGYFNARFNCGALDDLHLKVLLFEQEGVIGGFASFDLCYLTDRLVEEMRKELIDGGMEWAKNVVFCATHTHTGPQLNDFFGLPGDADYCEELKVRAFTALSRAYANLSEATLGSASVVENPYSFVRRYWMKDGKVVTNPGKLNPDIVRPESDFDRTIKLLAVCQEGRISALIVNLANHTDTIGGDFVSADWPGRMEEEIQYQLGEEIPVLTLMAPSGDINHFDVSQESGQTSYEEARRIGRGYGTIIMGMLKKLSLVDTSEFSVTQTVFSIPYRTIPAADVENAKKYLAETEGMASSGDLTSEGIASGDCSVARFFAANLVEYHQTCEGKSRDMRMLALKFNDSLAFVSLPGEPFNGIGREIVEKSPFRSTVVVELGMGECGYVPLPECFGRGGYEVMPVAGGSPREDTATRMIESALSLL